MEYLTTLFTILKVVVGLGFVIFIHELGHFLAAKWAGVKVEKFAVGFDFGGLRLWSRQLGETVYVLGAIPLGGYVKMLGEGDAEEGAEKTTDPRAFVNKSVGARMVIMSAGVVMNLLLGVACFALVYTQGTLIAPARLGGVVAGSPAYEAGLRPGDEIVGIDGRSDLDFLALIKRVKLSGSGDVVRLSVRRAGSDELTTIDVEPKVDASTPTPQIGIYRSEGLELVPRVPFLPPAGYTADQAAAVLGPLKSDMSTAERVVAAGPAGETPEPVATIEEFHRVLDRHRDSAVVVELRRIEGDRTGPPAEGDDADSGEPFTITLPPNHFLDLGFRPAIEPIAAIQPGSPAEKAGLRKGDRIVSVDGNADFDPLRLPSYARDRAGQALALEVERPAGADGEVETVAVSVTPDDTPAWVESAVEISVSAREPLEVPGLGLAYQVRPSVRSVAADSPAAKAGLRAGDRIASLSVPPPPAPETVGEGPSPRAPDTAPEPIVFKFEGEDPDTLAAVFAALQLRPLGPITLTLVGGKSPIAYTPEVDPTWAHPIRGLQFVGLTRWLPPQGLASSLRRGLADTADGVTDIYAMFRGLIQSRVGRENLAGLPRIAGIAYEAASAGPTALLQFLGMLSVNLAVLNFLPIPPLDGGQMLFLAAEKVRGRPLPESAVNVGMLAGLALVLGLMLFTILQDIVILAWGS